MTVLYPVSRMANLRGVITSGRSDGQRLTGKQRWEWLLGAIIGKAVKLA